MKVEKKDLEKSQIEFTVELSFEEFKPYIEKGAKELSKHLKIDGFRESTAPMDIIKQKVGEMAILEESARLAINKTLDQVLKDNLGELQPVGQPQITISKLAPANPLEYKVTLAILPQVTLGEYKDFKIKQEKIAVKEEEILKVLESLREMRAIETASEQPAKKGDKVLADIEMFLDKVPVDGGQSKNSALITGKDYIVPGLSEKIIGMKKGEIREFILPFPKEHHMKNLAGKAVEFKVKVNDIFERKLPDLNEDFAKTLQAKNIQEIKDSIKKNMEHEKEHEGEQKIESEILNKALDKAKFGELPEALVQYEAEGLLDEIKHSVESQGGKFDEYLQSIHKTTDQMVLDLLPEAVKRVKVALLIKEISLKENIKAEDKEVEEKIKELLEQYKGYEKVAERIKDPHYKDHMKNMLTNRKVIEKLKEWNIVK